MQNHCFYHSYFTISIFEPTCANSQIEVECIFRALQGPLNLHCIRIRAVTVRTTKTYIKYTEISGPPESTLHPNQGSCSAHY